MDSDSGLQNIKKMYQKITYFDQYGGSVLLFIIITIVLLIFISYCYVKINSQPIIDDWVNQRCNINIIPFAGFIYHPEGISASDYTAKNFAECTQTILSNMTGYMVEPLTFIIKSVNLVVNSIKNVLNYIRVMFYKVRTFFQTMAEELMGRLMNIMIPLQQIIINLKDFIGKIQGTMTAGLFTLLGSYYTLKALLGAIAEFIVTILIALAILIAVFWIMPFTWGFAITNTVIFVAIAIPLAIILVFMSDVLKVKTNLSIPEVPSVKCFDENTLLCMNNGNHKKISEIKVGDLLSDNNLVTAVIKVETHGSKIYNLDNILVSDSHIVLYKDKWIYVSHHPESKLCEFYDKPYLYCLNTSNKIINIKGHIFSDWDEIYEKSLYEIKNNKFIQINETREIHTFLDGGFEKNTEIKLINGSYIKIKDIEIGNILSNGERVYGIVEINGNTTEQYIYNLGKNVPIIGAANLNICNPNFLYTSTLSLDKSNKYKINKSFDKLYHLLTNTKTFDVENIKFYDYNASIDLFLDKYRGKLLSMKYV
jgi:hypothetical protein